jgi:hypothetical protein
VARPTRYCVAPGGCPTKLSGKVKSEFCFLHRCAAFSVSYGECVQGQGHQNKHINNKNQEWGSDGAHADRGP